MAISKIGGSGSDNWELISSVTPTAASAAVNFTGLSLYRKLLLIWDNLILGSSGNVSVRLNNDSGSNYAISRVDYNSSTPSYTNGITIFDTQFSLNTGGLQPEGMIELTNCDTSGLKNLSNGAVRAELDRNLALYGYYKASNPVTQVNFITNTTFTAVGTVALYGVK